MFSFFLFFFTKALIETFVTLYMNAAQAVEEVVVVTSSSLVDPTSIMERDGGFN
jgi:hypothetical protein